MSTNIQSSTDLDAKRIQILNDIEQKFADSQEQEQHIDISKERINRNILLVGLSKSGKTILRRVLKNPRYISEELSLRLSSDAAAAAACELNIQPFSSFVTLNIVELPEKMISTTSDLPMINEECARLDIQDFHIICLCASFDIGIDEFTIQSFERFINHLGAERVTPNLCLIITRCESKTDTQRQKLLNELMENPEFDSIKQCLGLGIHFSGSLNRDTWNRANETLYSQYETVHDYRRNLLELIAKDIKPFYIPSSVLNPDVSLPTSIEE